MVGLAVTAVVLAGRYQPVHAGSTSARPLAEEGRAFGISIRNDGRFTLRVASVDVPDGMRALLALRGQPTGIGPRVPFRPFELKAGEERFVWTLTTLPFCARPLPASAAYSTIVSQIVHYKVFGLAKTAEVPLYTPVRMLLPPAGPCVVE